MDCVPKECLDISKEMCDQSKLPGKKHTMTDIPEPVEIQRTEKPEDKIAMDKLVAKDYHKADEMLNPPCYLPQPEDSILPKDQLEPMGPIGPWATGKVDWSPMAGLTGTRPVVDRYSITRFSSNEWRKRNKEILDKPCKAYIVTRKTENDCKNTLARTNALIDKTQSDCTNLLKVRSQLIHKWKCTLEEAIEAQINEITTMEEQRLRLKQSLAVLQMPESIAGECLERRTSRPETELVRDVPEEELIKELALIAEIRTLLKKTLNDIEEQQLENRAAQQKLEYDWSDKKISHDIDTINVALNNRSTITMFYPGSTRFSADQSTEETWEHFTTESLKECEKVRAKSVQLRSTLDSILLNAARDLRQQADVVERAFSARIQCMEQIERRLENELKEILQKLADIENLIISLTTAMQNLDYPMKVAQTRLHTRNERPHVENTRDPPQCCLVNEVKVIQDGVSALLASINEAENTKNILMTTRGELEREIMLKRRTIMLDKNRCMLIRSHFPSATALSGYAQA